MRAWAVARGDPWYILSARHGLLAPETVVEPYNERGLSVSQSESVSFQLSQDGVDTVHLTAGSDYTNVLIPELKAVGLAVVNHFEGLGIGRRRSQLQDAVRGLKNQGLES
jgi:hypothetical protein